MLKAASTQGWVISKVKCFGVRGFRKVSGCGNSDAVRIRGGDCKNKKPSVNLSLQRVVELAGVEPASKHIPGKLSTCLFPY